MNVIHCYYLISLLFYISVSSEARVFFVPEKNMQILAEGDPINVTCIYQGDAIPSEDVQIKRNEQDLKEFEFTRKGSLSPPWNKTTTGLKANASCADDGHYTCSIGKMEKNNQNIYIIRVVHSSSNLSHLGGDAVLQCAAQGCSGDNHVIQNISWSHGGKNLMTDEKYNITPNGSLVIKNAGYSDLGPYQCKIVVYHDEDDTDKLIFPIFSVNLQGPPKVTIEGNKDIYVCENHPVRVLCKTEGFPKPDVVWHARLENASEESPPLPDGNELHIETFKSIHEGNYTCIANSFMFPQVEVKDSVRMLLDGKGHCGPVSGGINLSVIIAVSVIGTLGIAVGIVVLVVCLRKKSIGKHSDEQPKSSSTENEADSLKEEDIKLEQKSPSTNHYSSADEPLLQESPIYDSPKDPSPPPKPPRTFSFK
ncbi:hypothetical protein ACJMK2_044304 [Sinanodonta woodiana]|uniref:Ig-like domain-containing protein n=1 Tax=Sinanodonta woodiana TaxID=1069815 RepID=A0ABD3W108_SINWO